MSKQLNLFGKRALPPPYFANPKTDYQKFVNKKWVENEGKFGRKTDFLNFVLKEWEKSKDNPNVLDKFLAEPAVEPLAKTSRKSFVVPTTHVPVATSLPTSSTSPSPAENVIVRAQPSPSPLLTLNVPNRISEDNEKHLEARENYLASHELVLIKKFFTDIGFDEHDEFFTDDINSDEGLMKTLASVAYDWSAYFDLIESYANKTKFEKKSQLREDVTNISDKCNFLNKILKEISELKITPKMVASLISAQFMIKADKIKNLLIHLGVIQTKISDKSLLSNLRRRVKQQSEADTSRRADELPRCSCYNNSKLTWSEVFDELINVDNSNISLKPLNVEAMMGVAKFLSENIVILDSELPVSLNSEGMNQILKYMPVMHLSNGLFLNLCEFVYTPGAVEVLLNLGVPKCLDTIPEEPETLSNISEEGEGSVEISDRELHGDAQYQKRGKPSIVSKFPEIVDIAAEYVKQHGFSAQFRRRTETGYSSGVTIPEIREHLLAKIPGLKHYGMSLSTTRRLFQAPNNGNRASRRYQGLVDARIGIKSNCYREHHPDAHYLFSRNKHRREFCSLFESECCIISMDDMAKLKVGAPAVSRYHQIRRLFPTSDAPNYKDHDFPVSNYLLSVSGYMFLEDHGLDESLPASTIVNDVEGNNDNAYDGSLASLGEVSCGVSSSNEGTIERIEDTYGVIVEENGNNEFWNDIVNQCLHQMNLKTSENELRATVMKEILEHKEFYCKKFEAEEYILTEFCDDMDSKLRTCILYVDMVSTALCSILDCQVIQLNCPKNYARTITGRMLNSNELSIYIGVREEDRLLNFCTVEFKKENVEKYKQLLDIPTDKIAYDGIGRIHLDTPYSGKSFLRLRSHKYNSTTISTHISDLYEMLIPLKDSKSVFMFLADGGPDFNPSHIVNELFYYRLFKKLDADILGVMTYAARYSAFNPIEHLWAPLSNRLSGVVFSPTIEGETVAPVQQGSIDNSTLIEKESVVFDSAMKSIRDEHWKDFKFDEFEMDLDVVNCNKDRLLFDDYEQVKAALKSGIRNLHHHSSIIKEFAEMHKHIDRHLNEIIFVKCIDKTCCKTFRSDTVKEHFGGNLKIKFPSPSINKNGHYNTFLQECIN